MHAKGKKEKGTEQINKGTKNKGTEKWDRGKKGQSIFR